MVSTQKKKQQNKKLLSQLSEPDANFVIGQSNHEIQTKSRVNVADREAPLKNTNDTTQINGPQVDIHTLEKNIVSKVRSEGDSVMTNIETKVHDAVLSAIENLVILRT